MKCKVRVDLDLEYEGGRITVEREEEIKKDEEVGQLMALVLESLEQDVCRPELAVAEFVDMAGMGELLSGRGMWEGQEEALARLSEAANTIIEGWKEFDRTFGKKTKKVSETKS